MTPKTPAGRQDARNNAATPADTGELGQTIALVKAYAKQETLGPLKGAGRWIGRGIAGALLLALGSGFLVLGVLRLLQTSTGDTFRGRWMGLIPYAVALVVALVVIGLSVWRISKPTLQKETR